MKLKIFWRILYVLSLGSVAYASYYGISGEFISNPDVDVRYKFMLPYFGLLMLNWMLMLIVMFYPEPTKHHYGITSNYRHTQRPRQVYSPSSELQRMYPLRNYIADEEENERTLSYVPGTMTMHKDAEKPTIKGNQADAPKYIRKGPNLPTVKHSGNH